MLSWASTSGVATAARDLLAAQKLQRAEGPASILSLGTANPPTPRLQSNYADYYFGVTGSDHMLQLKNKFHRICKKSEIKKRYTNLIDDILAKNPNLCTYDGPSLNVRQGIANAAITKMATDASIRALDEWGNDRSSITHLVFCTSGTTSLPGTDYHLLDRLNLQPTVHRLILSQQGCNGGAAVLRHAKTIAESDRRARVLAVCSDTTAAIFRGPNPADLDCLVCMALFGDGAAAAVVGADARGSERPLFHVISTAQEVIPASGELISAELTEAGLVPQVERDVPRLVKENVERWAKDGLSQVRVKGEWDSAFWAVHPGGKAILNAVEEKLRLGEGKLKASRKVMAEYGNMSSSTVMFVLDEMRRRSEVEGLGTTGEGCEVGMLLAFGPGLTMESLLLHSVPFC